MCELLREETKVDPLKSHDFKILLGDTWLVGRLDDLWPHSLVRTGYGKIDGKRKLDLWIRHLALNCMENKLFPKNSLLIGRSAKGKSPTVLKFREIDDDPQKLLGDLIELFWLGQREPLRFFPKTSLAEAGESTPEKPVMRDYKEVREAWLGGYMRPGESENAYISRVFGNSDPLTDPERESDLSFPALALRVFGPMNKYAEGGAS